MSRPPLPHRAGRLRADDGAVQPGGSVVATTLILVVVVAALYLGRDILIPFALAVLLCFALAPIVSRLRRLGLGRVIPVLLVVSMVCLSLFGFGTVVGIQLVDLAESLPRYEQNLRSKIRELGAAAPGGGVFEQTSQVIEDLGAEIDQATQGVNGTVATTSPAGETDVVKPIPVEVHQPPPGPVAQVQEFLGPLFAPLATAGLVLVFVIFLLLQREDLRDRLIRLVGSRDIHKTTEAMTDAGRRISRYLLMQLVINVAVGIMAAVGLYFIGVPNAVLWGLFAAVLRFIPFLGPAIAALLPITVSLAIDPGWTMPLLTIGLFIALEAFSGNVLEPWLYGSSTGLSSVAIIVAAVFWTTLWGPVGLLLATPLTVCLVVLGTHVPQLRFFEVLLGTEPVLEPEVKFYQRLLVGDTAEAIEVAEAYAAAHSVPDLYGRVIVPALIAAEQDRIRGVLDRARQTAMAEDLRLVLEYFAQDADDAAAGTPTLPAPAGPVVCVGGRNGFDAVAAALLVDLLDRRGIPAVEAPPSAAMPGQLAELPAAQAACLCVLYTNAAATQHAGRLVGRLHAHLGAERPPIVFGMLGSVEAGRTVTGVEAVESTLGDVADRVEKLLRPPAAEAA